MTGDIPFTDVDVRELLHRGHKANQVSHREFEQQFAGQLRAGNAGCIDTAGNIHGKCHRVSHLRQLGVEEQQTVEKDLMFDAGYGNEDLWDKVTVPAWPGKVLRKTVVQKQGSWGTVTGHPDIVLADADGVAKLLLELKLLCSNNSAMYRGLDGQPEGGHLVQAAAYMWITGLPTVLCYTSRTDFALEFHRKRYGGLTKIKPFYRLFYLAVQQGTLVWRDEQNLAVTVPTLITLDGVRDYYQLVHDMAHDYNLRQRPSALDVQGDQVKWNKCDPKYCVFAGACDGYEHNYQTWLDVCKETVG